MATPRTNQVDRTPTIGVNLLFLCEGYKGGTYRYAKEIVTALAKQRRWKLRVYCQKGAFTFNRSLECVSIHETAPMRSRLIRVVYEQLILPLIAIRHQIDLMFSPGFVSPLFGPFRKVATIHDLYYRKYPKFVRWSQRLYWQLMVPLTLKACDHVVAVSDSTVRDIKGEFPWVSRKLIRIWNGTSKLSQKKRFKRVNRNYILFVGYITPNKNIGVLISALELINREEVRCELWVVGQDIYGLLRTEVQRSNGKSAIKVFSRVSDDELARLYQGAICLVVPSEYEGFGLPVLEAMDNGCPVVSSGTGALKEIVGSSGIFFHHDSPKELAEAIARLISDQSLRKDYIERGHKNAQRFTWSLSAKQLAQCFCRALSH